MNTRKLSRKNVCEDDELSWESASSVSRISSENSDSDDEEDSISSNDDIDGLQYKFACLKGTYFEKKLEHSVLKRCIEVENVSKFINDLFSKEEESEDSSSEKQKRTIRELYERNKELISRLKAISKKNKETTKEICQLYCSVEELMEERKKVWDEAVKMHKLNLGDSSAFLNFDETDPFNESNIKQKEKEYLLRGMDYGAFTKSFQVVQMAKVFYNLICNSEVSWSKNKNLLEILECSSKLFDRNFDLKNRNEFMSIVNEVILRLEKVKM